MLSFLSTRQVKEPHNSKLFFLSRLHPIVFMSTASTTKPTGQHNHRLSHAQQQHARLKELRASDSRLQLCCSCLCIEQWPPLLLEVEAENVDAPRARRCRQHPSRRRRARRRTRRENAASQRLEAPMSRKKPWIQRRPPMMGPVHLRTEPPATTSGWRSYIWQPRPRRARCNTSHPQRYFRHRQGNLFLVRP